MTFIRAANIRMTLSGAERNAILTADKDHSGKIHPFESHSDDGIRLSVILSGTIMLDVILLMSFC